MDNIVFMPGFMPFVWGHRSVLAGSLLIKIKTKSVNTFFFFLMKPKRKESVVLDLGFALCHRGGV